MQTLLMSAAIVGILLQSGAASAQPACACGPDFCPSDARIPALLQQKKASLARSYPPRLVALLDRGPQCVARIQRSPDIFTLWLVDRNESKQTVPWSADDEARAKNHLVTGELKRFWIVHTKRAFSCCGQPPYNQMPDYNADDDVNTSLAIKCDRNNPC